MGKTAKEWYQQLPEPIRSQAVANSRGLDVIYSTLSGCLFANFTWTQTAQGEDYWYEIHFRAQYGEFDQPEPNLHGWIAVTDRLPTAEDGDENGEVLVLLTPNKIPKKTIFAWRSLQNASNETMWQPLPKLPEVKGGENA